MKYGKPYSAWVFKTVSALIVIFSLISCADPGNNDNGPPQVSGTVATPAENPAAGEVEIGTAATLSTTTADADIWYSTDGSDPSKGGTDSTRYTSPIPVTSAITIKAIAVKDGMNDSAILTAAYTVRVTDFEWEVNNLNNVIITGYVGTNTDMGTSKNSPSLTNFLVLCFHY